MGKGMMSAPLNNPTHNGPNWSGALIMRHSFMSKIGAAITPFLKSTGGGILACILCSVPLSVCLISDAKGHSHHGNPHYRGDKPAKAYPRGNT